MKLSEINLRDPYIFPYQGNYYMTGTRAKTCWGEANGFDGYVSKDLQNWDGPFEIFHRTPEFLPDRNYWAPEIHMWKDNFYLFATFGISSLQNRKGTMILKADNPLGPYQVHSDGWITPTDWNCLDGTFYISKDNRPYMIFSHEWVDIGDGEILFVELSEDLKKPVSTPQMMFKASMAKPWVKCIQNRQWNGPAYVTDGPFVYRKNKNELILLWATFGSKGYAEAIARSDNGEITGKWTIDNTPLYDDNGGHGMVFKAFDGKEYLVLHKPNNTPMERPVLIPFSI